METLEFIIHPDGRVEERVTGMVGSSCAEVTAAIEAKLGMVVSRELTSDHFNHVATHSNSLKTESKVDQALDFSRW
jgi:riboflavin synthase